MAFRLVPVAAVAAILSISSLANAAVGGHDAEALKANISLTQAVESGEKAGQGKTIGVEFDVEHDKPIWEVKVLNASGVTEYKVDAQSGEVLKVEKEHLRGKLTTLVTGLKLDQLQQAGMPLSQAVAMAESKLGGKAVKVEVEHEHKAIQYDVFVRRPDKTEHMKIEAGGAATR